MKLRLSSYYQETAPIVPLYEKIGKVISINADDNEYEVHLALTDRLESFGLEKKKKGK